MKKFISMVMAAAMVVSLVPATAFAATGTVEAKNVKVLDAVDFVEDADTKMVGDAAPAVSFKVDTAETAADSTTDIVQEVKIKLDGAKFIDASGNKVEDMDKVVGNNDGKDEEAMAMLEALFQVTELGAVAVNVTKVSNTSVTFNLEGTEAEWQAVLDADDSIEFHLQSVMNKDNAGATAKVTVISDIEGLEVADKVYATVEGKGVDVELEDDVVEVAPEEKKTIEDIVIEPSVGSTIGAVADAGKTIKLSLSKGFEFGAETFTVEYKGGDNDGNSFTFAKGDAYTEWEDDEVKLTIGAYEATAEELTITGIEIDAVDAKAGDECTLTVKVDDNDSVKLVVAKVIEAGLVIEVDEDEDVPVMWSGVDSTNYGLTADTDEHKSLEVTIKETFPEAYSDKDEIELVLPEGVYVVAADLTDENGTFAMGGETGDDALDTAFENAYNEGEYKSFIFERDAFNETTVGGDEHEMTVEFTLTADPGFVGDVTLEMLVEGESVGEVVIAKFETPMVIEAQQNDLKIDYRYTEVPTDIVVKEAEAGLWKKATTVSLAIEDGSYIDFEDDAVFTVNEDSDMEIKDSTKNGKLSFTVKEESDEEPAVVTISGISLYMDRNLAAGAYDLTMTDNTCVTEYLNEVLFGAEAHASGCPATFVAHYDDVATACDKDVYVYDVSDYSDVVKEAFVNIVTAGREQDDASFTTKVVVPVGESYIVAGEATVALDVPAYVSEAGYTMLPVRAVATGLGINNNNVLWDQTTKTVTILYGQRIITMVAGQKVVNVNGSVIPASATVEIVDGRAFLPMRDLATALGVTDITWDAATKTATLNGNA